MQKFDIAIIGGGAAGLVTASVAAQLGYKVVLFEKDKMGGECLNSGCVPSKALLAAAKDGQTFTDAMAHVHKSIAKIAPHDSVERFEGLGVTVIQKEVSFINSRTLKAGPDTYTARRIVIATGSTAAIPPISGLTDVPYLTNDTLFKLTEKPKHLAIIGAGPIGCEMAQAFKGLGSEVTLIEGAGSILPRDDADARAVVADSLRAKGVTIRTATVVKQVEQAEGGLITLTTYEGPLLCSHILVAAGRAPTVYGMGVDKAGVIYNKTGIQTGASGRTNKRHIYALGDVTGKHPFTHMAAHDATIFIKRVLFGAIFAKENKEAMPWVTFTSPELAQIGLTEKQAKEKDPTAHAVRINFNELDRAVTDGDADGFCKVILNKKSHILGATIVGFNAGEMLPLFCYMMHHKRKFSSLSGMIWAYPTRGEIYGKILSKLSSPLLKKRTVRCISQAMYRLFG